MDNPVLVELLRGGHVESAHRGAIAVFDADRACMAALGDIERPVFPRSAVKALQALPLIESGAADQLALTDDELALACASHGGEPAHVRTAASMLAKAGLDAGALECGTHWPLHEPSARALAAAGQAPIALHNNCSGKHAGFLCVACIAAGPGDLRAYARGYVQPAHPVMREVAATLSACTGIDLERDAPAGTDGCSIPAYAVPLRHLALAFARFGSGTGLDPGRAKAAARLRAAAAKVPAAVAGSGRFDTRVIERFGERVFCKVGAEGVYCGAFPERGLGVAIKIDDGGSRAAEVAMAAAVEGCLPLGDADVAFMRAFSDQTLRNWNGIEVGQLRAHSALRQTLHWRRA